MEQLFDETKRILKKYGISANKSLGQNFLIKENVVKTIIEKSEITKEDLVIEIGPGLGTLTKELLEHAGKVIAIELDKRMIEILTDRFDLYDNFELINEDVLKVNLDSVITSNLAPVGTLKKAKIVANLPYYITTPIIMKLLENKLNIESITVMIQKEVADRLVAIPGRKNTGAITYSVYYYAKAQELLNVEKDSFIPEPAVESEIIKLEIRKEPPVEVLDKDLMFKIIKYAFMQRRKTLVNSLEKSGIFENKKQIIEILEKLGIDKKIRGEMLSLDDFKNIANEVINL